MVDQGFEASESRGVLLEVARKVEEEVADVPGSHAHQFDRVCWPLHAPYPGVFEGLHVWVAEPVECWGVPKGRF